jgi:predicted NAD-dependent protein-ADP-ribosyltransferase YbiA (DUF1768 family)
MSFEALLPRGSPFSVFVPIWHIPRKDKIMPVIIRSFTGRYAALSSTFLSGFFYDGDEYQSVAAAFEAAKIVKRADRVSFFAWNTKPWEARRKGKAIPASWIRPDFDLVQADVMLAIQRSRFSWPETQRVLVETGSAELIYGNVIHDNLWGICSCLHVAPAKLKYGIGRNCAGTGQNLQGRILMQVRQELLEAARPVISASHRILEKEYA